MQESRRFDDAKINVKVQSTATCFVVLLTISLEKPQNASRKKSRKESRRRGQTVEKFFVNLQRKRPPESHEEEKEDKPHTFSRRIFSRRRYARHREMRKSNSLCSRTAHGGRTRTHGQHTHRQHHFAKSNGGQPFSPSPHTTPTPESRRQSREKPRDKRAPF